LTRAASPRSVRSPRRPRRWRPRCLGLAARLTERAEAIGLRRVTGGPASQIVLLHTDRADRVAERLREHGVRATALGDRIRFGFHYFNDERDVEAALRALG
jgi:selenocysteine lyase/cysteine desulfurase